MEPPGNTRPEDLDPANPGTHVFEGGSSSAADDRDPYTLNFLVERDPDSGEPALNFDIPRPDPNLETTE